MCKKSGCKKSSVCESCGKKFPSDKVAPYGERNIDCCGDNNCKALIDLNDKVCGDSFYQFLECSWCGKVYGVADENNWTDEGFCSIECAKKYEEENEW